MKSLALLSAALVVALFQPLRAGAADNLVQAKLLANVATVQPGQSFEVGVLFDIQPEWHIYWTNPGDSGLATTVSLVLPDGFTAGPVRYPAPTRIDLPGNILAYGYSQQVLLTATVTPPKTLEPGQDVAIAAKTSWLVCQTVCIPGSASPKLALKVAGHATPANADLFQQWVPKMPVPAHDAPIVASIQQDANAQTHAVSIVIKWKVPVTNVQFFPGADDAVTVKDLSAASSGPTKESRISLMPELLPGQALSKDELPSVVAYTDGAGSRRALALDVPLGQLKKDLAKKGGASQG